MATSRARPEFWTTSGHGPGELTSQWQQMLSATHLPWRVRVDPAGTPFEAWVRRLWLDDLAILDCACGPCSGTRRRCELADTHGEYIVLLIALEGEETVAQGPEAAELRPGDAVAWVSTAPARFTVWTPLVKRSLLVPKGALEEAGGGHLWRTAGVRLDGAAPTTRLLVTYLDALVDALPSLGPEAVGAARNATLALVRTVLSAQIGVPACSATHPDLRAVMGRYIDRHLVDATVTSATLARAHGVSTRTVNRVFHESGETVGEIVRLRRLARAREDLVTGDRSIAAIAHRWGFADGSHFSRSFRAQYGWSPREYRHAARTRIPPGVQGPNRGALVHASAADAVESGAVTG